MATQIGSSLGTISAGSGRIVVRTSSGTLYAVVYHSSAVHVYKSSDGSSWTEQDSGHAPSVYSGNVMIGVAIDSSDKLHFAYVDYTGDEIYVIPFDTSTDTYGTSEDTNINFGFGVGDLAIAIDSNDIPHVVGSGATTGATSCKYSNRVGGSWLSTPIAVYSSSGVTFVDILIDNNNYPEIVYYLSNTAYAAIGNANNATSFTSQSVISSLASSRVSIVMDSSNNTYISATSSGGLIKVYKHASGASWSTWSDVSVSPATTGYNSSLAINGTDVYLFYQDGSSGGNIKYLKYTGSWSSYTTLESGTYYRPVAKWSYLNNNGGSSQIDFLFDDGTGVYWDKLTLSSTTITSITKSLQYTVKTTPSALTKSLKYTVPSTPTALTKSLEYTILSTPSALTKSLKYTIFSTPSALTKSLKYTILHTPTALTQSLEYTIKTNLALTKSLQYTIDKALSITKSLKYTVITTPSVLTKSLVYHVDLGVTAITKSLEYTIIVANSLTKSLKYTILNAGKALTKSLQYGIGTPSGWQNYRSITIDHTKCGSSDSTDFPVLIKGTYSYLKTSANGGKVQNSNGYDIAFFSDSSLTTMLKFERVAWDATTGDVVFWVKVPTLSHSSDTVIYLGYNNSSISTDQQDAANTWSAMTSIWHYSEPSGTTVKDSAAGHNGTINSGLLGNTGAPTGNYAAFSGNTSEQVNISNTSDLEPTGNFSIGAWMKQSATGVRRTFMGSNHSGANFEGFNFELNPSNNIYLAIGHGAYTEATSSGAITDTSGWHRVIATYDGSYVKFYIDGVYDSEYAVPAYASYDAGNQIAQGVFLQNSTYYYPWNGGLAGIFLQNGTVMSADWATADYNNQSSPSTFYSVGSEQTNSSAVSFEIFLSLKYAINAATTTSITKSLKYTVLATPSALTKSLKYTIFHTPSALTQSLKYTILTTPSALTKSLQYAIGKSISLTKSLKYTILAPVALTKSLKYTIPTTSSLTKSLKYTVLYTPSALTKSLKYTVLTAPGALTKSLRYAIDKKTAITKSLKYTILATPSALTESLKYTVTKVNSLTKSLKYTITSPVVLTKSLKYTIVHAPSALTKSLKYTIVAAPSALTKSLKYTIKTNSAIIKSLQYTIQTATAITKSLEYFLSASTYSITKVLQYTIGVRATGGTITTSGGYVIHTFTTSGTFTPSGSMTIEVLVQAGGGGGGSASNAGGGGGGAGGYRYDSSHSVIAQAYSVTVGTYGAGGSSNHGSNGTDSTFDTITSTGGGGGGQGSASSSTGQNGGSGGGAGSHNPGNIQGTGISGQGYNGGQSLDNGTNKTGGGGGGATAAGGNGTTSKGGNGGAGVSNSISGTAVTYASGGGGGGYNASAGSTPSSTYGGGGAGASNGNGSNGQNGVVIIRYPQIGASMIMLPTQYTIDAAVSLTESLKYTILVTQSALQKTISYSIVITKLITKSMQYRLNLKWHKPDKNSAATWTKGNKNSTNWTNKNKNSSTVWTNKDKIV